jgi:hypothetical protein
MLNVDYSRRLKTTGTSAYHDRPILTKPNSQKVKMGFPLFIGGILLFTGGMVVGLNLNQSESKFQNNQSAVSLQNTSEKPKVIPQSDPEEELNLESKISDGSEFSAPAPTVSQNNPSYYPKNLKYPPKMDQINYLIEIGAYEPVESSRVGKMVTKDLPELQGKIFRTSMGKLFAGYFYSQEEAKQVLEHLRTYEKDDFTSAEIKTVRF